MTAFLTIATIHLLAVMSPGPDFALTLRNSLCYSRRTGFCTAAGLGMGILVHSAYSLLGIGLLISQSILLYSTIKFLGAGYLIYIGWKALRSKSYVQTDIAAYKRVSSDISVSSGIRMGFLCNVLNPKATLFFLSLFTQVIDPATPFALQCFYGGYMAFATFLWFAFVAFLFSNRGVRSVFDRIRTVFDRVMGALLVTLGFSIAFSSNE